MTGVFLTLMVSCLLLGWARLWREDQDVFRQAEVIAVGQIRPGSVRLFPLAPGLPPEYGALLEVTELLKGKLIGPELDMVLHNGLTPVVGGFLCEAGHTIDAGHRRVGVIEIYDTACACDLRVADARDAHIWFLARHTNFYQYSYFGPVPLYARLLGVAEPDEIRSLSERDAIVRWLALQGQEATEPDAAPDHGDMG